MNKKRIYAISSFLFIICSCSPLTTDQKQLNNNNVKLLNIIGKDTICYCDTILATYKKQCDSNSNVTFRFTTINDTVKVTAEEYFINNYDCIKNDTKIDTFSLRLGGDDYFYFSEHPCNQEIKFINDNNIIRSIYYACDKNPFFIEVDSTEIDSIVNKYNNVLLFFGYPCVLNSMQKCQVKNIKYDSLKIYYINIHNNQSLITKYGINAIPAFIFFKNQENVITYIGGKETSELDTIIHNIYGNIL
jgi:thioredoxin-related protein